MQIPRLVKRGPVRFNMTPMIDVVFLLIIFFLVSSHLAKQEAQLELPLPDAASGESAVATGGPRVIINLLRDGQIRLSGRSVQPRELELRLRQELQQEGPGLEVRIRADRQVPYEFVDPLLARCARAGIRNVTFAVYREESLR